MTDPLGFVSAAGRVGAQGAPTPSPGPEGGASFKDVLMANLMEVNALQQDATKAVEDLQAGRRMDLEGVLLATQKADTAFRMLQAVRNKVIAAYEEVQQMRV